MTSFFDDLEIRHKQSILVQNTDYYPFGSVQTRNVSPGRKQYRFGYQGEFAEEDEETGWNSFELRMYDPVIARWLVPDPYMEFWSPYVAMGNDPINLIDPNGGMTSDPCPKCNAADTQWGALSEEYAVTGKWTKFDQSLYDLSSLFW